MIHSPAWEANMNLSRAWYWAAPLLVLAVGCKTGQTARSLRAESGFVAARSVSPIPIISASQAGPNERPPSIASLDGEPAPRALSRPALGTTSVTAVEYQEPLPATPADKPGSIPQEIVGDVLSREWLATEIEARNPSLEAMVAAWQSVAQLYPQRVTLDDPMLMGMIAPQSAASNVTETAYALQLNQKLPWLGKRRLRGAVADADADAAYQEAEDSRLQVRLAADMAFFEYFLAARLFEINQENSRKVEELRDTAQARYRANLVTQQDVLQAELELAELARRQLELSRMQQVAVARINTLLRRWPDAPLPPPPASLDPPLQPADPNLLWQTALQQRPDLAALAWRVQSEEAALELAYKNFYPDFDVFGRYDTFWQPASTQGPLRAQLGVAMNLPIYREKLQAAVAEAQFRVNRRRAEFEQRSLEIQYEVVSAAQQVEESRKTVELYSQRLVPTADQNVAAANANYKVNKLNFIELAIAQRQLISMRERQVEALIVYHRRLAELNRVTGGIVPQTP
jgi:outer membrane protein, heavy metal efflux system